MATTYRMRLKQGDIEFEIEGDRNYVSKTYDDLKEILGLQQTTLPLPPPGTQEKPEKKKSGVTKAPTGGKSYSPREFIDRYALKRHTDIVLGFGYFLEKVRGLKNFSGADINTCYYEAKVEPSNTSQMIINNIKKGFIMPSGKSGSRKGFMLTRTGEDFVAGGFKASKAK
jgi:hypothetical protein